MVLSCISTPAPNQERPTRQKFAGNKGCGPGRLLHRLWIFWTQLPKSPVSQSPPLRSPGLPHLAGHKNITMVTTQWELPCARYMMLDLLMSFTSHTSGERNCPHVQIRTLRFRGKQQNLDSNPCLILWSAEATWPGGVGLGKHTCRGEARPGSILSRDLGHMVPSAGLGHGLHQI